MSAHGIDWTEYPELLEGTDNMQSLAYTYGTVHTIDNGDLVHQDVDTAYHFLPTFAADARDVAIAETILAPILAGSRDGDTIDSGYRTIDPGIDYVVGGKYPGIAHRDSLPVAELAYRLHRYIVQTPRIGNDPKLIGIWRHRGFVYFDYVTIHRGLCDALAVAESRGQVAIYDPLMSRSIDVDTGRYIPR